MQSTTGATTNFGLKDQLGTNSKVLPARPLHISSGVSRVVQADVQSFSNTFFNAFQ